LKPSQIRKKTIRKEARDLVYSNNGLPYNDSFNPYVFGSVDHSRFLKAYISQYKLYHYCESVMNEMREVYGGF
jgi:hypothetical protein